MSLLSAGRLAALLVRLFPRRFRERHGRALVELYRDLERRGEEPSLPAAAADLLLSALRVHLEERRRSASGRPAVAPRSEPLGLQEAPVIERLSHDIRTAFRGLRRSPGFATVAVLTLALGIGANTAIFSIVHGVVLRALPLDQPDRLVAAWHRELDGAFERGSVTPLTFYDWRRGADSLEALAAVAPSTATLGTGEGGERLAVLRGTGELFAVAGERPVLGTVFGPEDDDPGAARVVVLGYGLWRRAFGADPGVVGRTVRVDGVPHTVRGVMPPGFQVWRSPVDAYLPMRWSPEMRANRDEYSFRVVGRLAAGATLGDARAELDAVMAGLRERYPREYSGLGANVEPLGTALVSDVRTPLWLVMAAVAVVLLIGCVNLAHLLLARSTVRREEMAVRRALGASRARIAGLVLAESLLLALAGGSAGLALAWVLLDGLVELLPAGLPRLDSVAIDPAVLAFTAGVTVLSALLFGLLPALRLPRAEALRGGRGARTGGRTRDLLIVAEVALSVVLLAGAGLLLRTVVEVQRVDPGYRTEGMLAFRTQVQSAGGLRGRDAGAIEQGIERARRVEEMLARIEALPGVESATAAINLPPEGSWNSAWFRRVDRPLDLAETPPAVPYRAVFPGYFRTLRIEVVAGRGFTGDDGLGGFPAAVINTATAERFFPEEDPLGRRIQLGPDGTFPQAEVVGVVDDGRSGFLVQPGRPMVYLPYALAPVWPDLAVAVRAALPPEELVEPVRRTVQELDPSAALYRFATFGELLAGQTATVRSLGVLLGSFAVVGLVLAAVGLFGVLSYSVGRRTLEMGVRLALGADGGALQRMVVFQGLARVGAGMTLGIAAAVALGRFLDGFLYGVTASDPLTYGAVVALLGAVALTACWLPARRAAGVDPAVTLRSE